MDQYREYRYFVQGLDPDGAWHCVGLEGYLAFEDAVREVRAMQGRARIITFGDTSPVVWYEKKEATV